MMTELVAWVGTCLRVVQGVTSMLAPAIVFRLALVGIFALMGRVFHAELLRGAGTYPRCDLSPVRQKAVGLGSVAERVFRAGQTPALLV